MIKRSLTLLMCLSILLMVLVVYEETEYAEKQQYTTAASQLGMTLGIPEQEGVKDPSVFWPIIKDAAAQSGVNLFRKADGFDSDDKPFVTYYLWLTSDETRFFDAFRLRDGRFPSASEVQEGSSYLSSEIKDDVNQIGIIDDIGRNDHYNIYSMERVFDSYKAAGNYVVEAPNHEAQRVFRDLVVEKFKKAGIDISLSETNGTSVDDAIVWGYQQGFAQQIVWFVILATIIMLFYRQISESKRTGILLLYGNGCLQAWYLVGGRFCLRTLSVCVVAAVIVALLVPGGTGRLVFSVFWQSTLVAAVLVAASFLTVILIKTLNVQEALKNRKDTRLLAVGNMVIKGVLSLVLIYMGAVAIARYDSAQKERELWGDWRDTSKYGIFYPYAIGLDGQGDSLAERARIVFDLYPQFNADGALYIDAIDYAYYTLEDGRTGYRSMIVNPNYLEVYPVKDSQGNSIHVSEDEEDWIVLVPETLKPEEREIREFFAKERAGDESAWTFDEVAFTRTVENPQTDQNVEIIWTAANQQVFSFSPDVYREDGNRIPDPILEVMTMGNSAGIDRQACILGGADDALKVKLDAGGTKETYERYLPYLQKYGLDDNLKQIVTMDELAFSLLQSYDESVRKYVFQMMIIFALFLALVIQSVPLVFELDARRIAVRKLYGYPFVSRNRLFFTVFVFNWLALLLISSVFNTVTGWPGGDYGNQDALTLLVVTGVFAGLEAAISACILSAVEKRRVVDVLKGEMS